MDADFEWRLPSREVGDGTGQILGRDDPGELVDRRQSHPGRHRVRGVRLDQQGGAFAAQHPAGEPGGNVQDELHIAARQRRPARLLVRQLADDVEVSGSLHRGENRSGHFAVIRGDDRRGHLLGVCVDGVPEQRQLYDGYADDHGEGEAVPPELAKFLEDDAPPPRKGKPVETTHVPGPDPAADVFIL